MTKTLKLPLRKKKTKKLSGEKVSTEVFLDRAMDRYVQAQAALAEFEQENEPIIRRLRELQSLVQETRADLETSARALALERKDGVEHKKDAYFVKVSRFPVRQVDGTKLLELLPEAKSWPGLFSVSMKNFDAACSANIIPSKVRKEVVSEKISYRVDLRVADVDGT